MSAGSILRVIKEALILFVHYGQRPLVYPAAFIPALHATSFGGIFTPATFGIPYMAPWLKTPDDSSYKMPTDSIVDERVELTEAAADARATVIVFHGNSMHNCQDYKEARRLYKMKCNVFLLSYRGYALSGGKPSEAGLRIDAQTALDYILSQPYLARVPIIVLGHSLGGGVAIDLASRNPSRIAAVIVSNTFTSIPDIVRTWPVIGHFSFICSQKWRSKDKLHLIPTTTPILMISGRQDEVIPAKLMDELWRAAQERGIRRKSSIRWPTICRAEDDTGPASDALPEHDEFVAVEGETHNTLPYSRKYWKVINRFVKKVAAQDRTSPAVDDINRTPDRRWQFRYPELMIDEPETA